MKLSPDQFADSGPAPTRSDAFTTVSHLADGVGHNLKHGMSHFMSLRRAIQNGAPVSTQLWHFDHSAKHMLEAKEHAEKLSKHVAKHPAFREATSELRGIDPMHYGGR